MDLQLTSQPINVKELIARSDNIVKVQYHGSGEYLNNLITDITFTNTPAQINLQVLIYTENKAKVTGEINAELWLICERCLENFAYSIFHQFSVDFVENIRESAREYELSEAEIDVLPLESGKIDIINLLREELLLSLPMKPLCSKACRGLCSMCGTNLNKVICNCTLSSDHHVAEKLKDILEKGKY